MTTVREPEVLRVTVDPAADDVYGFDWSLYLEGTRTISSATLSISVESGTDDPLTTLEYDGLAHTDTQVSFRLIGGTLGCSYLVRNRVTLSDGSKQVRRMRVDIKYR